MGLIALNIFILILTLDRFTRRFPIASVGLKASICIPVFSLEGNKIVCLQFSLREKIPFQLQYKKPFARDKTYSLVVANYF